MTSILLAFGIDAWWSDRQERQTEANILAGLTTEFIASRVQLDSVIELHNRQAIQAARLASMSDEDIRRIPADSIRPYITALAQGRTFDTFGGQLNAILNTDRLQLISDPGLREMLVVWSARVDDSGEEAAQMSGATQQVVYRMAALGGPYLARVPSEALRSPSADDLARFVGDETLMALSRAKFFWAAAYVSELRGMSEQANMILDRIEGLKNRAEGP